MGRRASWTILAVISFVAFLQPLETIVASTRNGRILRLNEEEEEEERWKQQQQQQQEAVLQGLRQSLLLEQRHEEYRVLALGGSVTWGNGLKDNKRKELAYPHLLSNHPNTTVDNLAMRSEGSTIPARCLQTLTTRDTTGFLTEHRAANKKEVAAYNVILLEFTINGVSHLVELGQRLRERYPDATIVYIDHHILGWTRQDKQEKLGRYIHPAMKEIGGHIYTLPMLPQQDRRRESSWFTPDGIHLSRLGHLQVATGILHLLNKTMVKPVSQSRIGPWSVGDYCWSWFMSGTIPPGVRLVGGRMVEFNSNGKFAYEIEARDNNDNNTAAIVQFHNPYSNQNATVAISFMVQGPPNINPYPPTRASLGQQQSTMVLETSLQRTSHIQKTIVVGTTWQEGTNTVRLEPLRKTKWPLRITGVSLQLVVASSLAISTE